MLCLVSRSLLSLLPAFSHQLLKDEPRSTPDLEVNVEKVIKAFRDRHRPVIHVYHFSAEPGEPFNPTFYPESWHPEPFHAPIKGEPILFKSTSSALYAKEGTSPDSITGRTLPQVLSDCAVESIWICGRDTNQCISSAVRSLADFPPEKPGQYRLVTVDDCTATFGSNKPSWRTKDRSKGDEQNGGYSQEMHQTLGILAISGFSAVTTADKVIEVFGQK